MVLNETQKIRDTELSAITGVSILKIEEYQIAVPNTLCIFKGENNPETKEEIEELYRDYKYCNITGYIRTLMFTSVYRRHPNLINLLKSTYNKKCLDFGSGVGTHSIALAENGCDVTLLDIDGPLLDFAKKRLQMRGLKFETVLSNNYDVIICSDVLEHVFNPLEELKRIHKMLKRGGILHLSVAEKAKNSGGHFKNAIDIWLKEGKDFVKKNFTKVQNTIYRKN